MTDAHCHVSCGDPAIRELLVGRDFFGVHPWEAEGWRGDAGDLAAWLRAKIGPDPGDSGARLPGVGEIGLDRLKTRDVSPRMREVFEVQLNVALEWSRPVVLHGAKCWGQVVKAIKDRDRRTAFLFHGFSRSDGLLPAIAALNGYVSVGPAVLNDHAVNYRALVKKIPLDRLLVETDRTPENAADCPSVVDVAAKVASLRGLSADGLAAQTDRNADAFLQACAGAT